MVEQAMASPKAGRILDYKIRLTLMSRECIAYREGVRYFWTHDTIAFRINTKELGLTEE